MTTSLSTSTLRLRISDGPLSRTARFYGSLDGWQGSSRRKSTRSSRERGSSDLFLQAGVYRGIVSPFSLKSLKRSQLPVGDGRIGKDDVRILSRANFERRIEELKQDSEGALKQGILIKGIYVIRQFCIECKTNLILVSEAVLQRNDKIRTLLYRLLDYRIIHSAGSAITHKSQAGTYHAMAIDIGVYAHMRVLHGKFTEVDLSDANAKEKMRSSPILDEKGFSTLWGSVPSDIEDALRVQDDA